MHNVIHKNHFTSPPTLLSHRQQFSINDADESRRNGNVTIDRGVFFIPSLALLFYYLP